MCHSKYFQITAEQIQAKPRQLIFMLWVSASPPDFPRGVSGVHTDALTHRGASVDEKRDF